MLMKKVMLMAAAGIMLAGCGQPNEEKIVWCSGFYNGVFSSRYSYVMGNRLEANQPLIRDIQSLMSVARDYRKKLDPSKANRLEDEGQSQAIDMMRTGDLDSAMGQFESCADAYRSQSR